jgi:small subunit ribosomal protein S8
MQDLVTNALNCIMNAKRAGKKFCIVPTSNFLIRLLEVMKKNGYVASYDEEHAKNLRNVRIEFGKLNECKAIKPRFYIAKGELDKYMGRFLPARDFGILILSTSKGLMTHKEAIEKGIGGSLIAYCF